MKKKEGVDKKGEIKSEGAVNKTSKQNSFPTKWFVFAVVTAIILSSIISLIVVSYSGGPGLSSDSGQIIVQINPDLESDGKIIVEIIDENGDKGVSS